MKRTKKKGTVKLRRRIRKTVASIFMIMAVVVAAIPVENLGTMQAATRMTDAKSDLSNKYNEINSAKQDLYDASTYEVYSNDISLQRIDGENFVTAFDAKRETTTEGIKDNAIITKYTSGQDSFTIQDTEYYNYVQMDGDYNAKIDELFKSEEYKVEFASTPTSYTAGSSTITLDRVEFTNNRTYSAVTSASAGTSITHSSNEYTKLLNALSTDLVKGFFESEAGKAALNAEMNTYIQNHNKQVDTYKSTLATLQANYTKNGSFTTTEQTQWDNVLAWTQKDEYKAALSTEMKYTDLTSYDINSNGLSDITEYWICNRMTDNGGGKKLTNYKLQRLYTEDRSMVYVPKIVNASQKADAQVIDKNGYLVKGQVNIVGIANGAFSKDNGVATVRTISVPGTVKFIGSDAFKNQASLATVTIDDSACEIIGDRAFYGCSALTTVQFTSANSVLETIGVEAFATTGTIVSITIPSTVTTIGSLCFFGSGLQTLTFANKKYTTLTLEPMAFYDCRDLIAVNFPADKNFIMKTAAFAYGSNGKDELQTFSFPDGMLSIIANGTSESNYDEEHGYILAGRANLKTVELPQYLGSGEIKYIPDTTLAGCKQLEKLVFSEDAYSADFDTEKLFQDIMVNTFIVVGPQYGATDSQVAKPRELTWDARITQGTSTYLVPYQYTDSKGKIHLEIGKPNAENKTQYIEMIDVTGASTATLSGYQLAEGGVTGGNISIEIPEKVGNYTITEIGKGCFSGDIKDKIFEVIISDGTVKKIQESAFEGCSELQRVVIGSSIREIGSKAFADCAKLENVTFSQAETNTWLPEDSYWSELKIASDAFKTGSQLLTFHGAIHPNYAPYIIASNKSNTVKSDLTGSGCEICYMTDAPLHLTVIKDRSTQKMTLIDYPHYEEIDVVNEELVEKLKEKYTNAGLFSDSSYSITEKFETLAEGIQVENTISTKYEKFEALDDIEKQIVEQTLDLKIPEGIESLDAKSFFTAEKANRESITGYFSKVYKLKATKDAYERVDLDRKINEATSGDDDVKALYSVDDTVNSKDIHAGLFSGYFNESIWDGVTEQITRAVYNADTAKLLPGLIWEYYDNHFYSENNDAGNDYLTSVNMETVESLPDYAFESNESLQVVSFDGAMTDVGILPFKDCKTMYDIQTNGNAYYSFDNMILYENANDDHSSGTEIVQCLEGRGLGTYENHNYGTSEVKLGNDPALSGVTSIAEGAFSDCTNLINVDLSQSSAAMIPEKCFYNCDQLTSVKLPETVSRIDEYAFASIDDTNMLSLEIPNPLCVISDKVFEENDDTMLSIQCIKYLDEGSGKLSPCYESVMQLQKKLGEDTVSYTELGNSYTVEFRDKDHKTIKTFVVSSGDSIEALPAAPTVSGYEFVDWVCRVGDKVLTGEAAYQNIKEDRIIYADYKANIAVVVPDGQKYTLTVVGGQGIAAGTTTPATTLTVEGGTSISLVYNEVSGKTFRNWAVTAANGEDYSKLIGNTNSSLTNFTMPNSNVTLTAYTTDGSTGGTGSSGSNGSTGTGGTNGTGSNNGSTGSDGTTNGSTQKYKLTVNYGTGSGEYEVGATVSITAYAPESSTKVFSRWTTTNAGVGFANATSSATTFTMPASAVVVTANYKTRTIEDEEEEETSTSNRRPVGSSTITTTTTTTTGTTDSTTGTTTTTQTTVTGNAEKDKLYINKNGVSNKDVGTASVDGSTDNFVIKVADSASATEQIKQALINKYGSLDGIQYFPMDISLYDATGNNKVQDTYGLDISVTMPIPDVLIQYGGNTHVATVENGYLQELKPRFTTIDGIACVSFTPPHFSPYVIYVDTNNLVAGLTYDATPATGDPIHPKWFLATGMACLSIFLFVSGDKKRKIKLA